MTHAARARVDLGQLAATFPAHATLLHELALRNEMFRAMCEDHFLASETLDRIEKLPASEKQARDITEYRDLIVELEFEIAAALEHARTAR